MKRILSLMFLFWFCLHASEAQDGSRIIIYRLDRFQAYANSYKIYANDSFLVRIKNKSWYTWNCAAGDYKLTVNRKRGTILRLKVEEGKTYYVLFNVYSGAWSFYYNLEAMDSSLSQKSIREGQLRNLNTNSLAMRHENRIGINFNLGGGSATVPMVQLANGAESTISFGGGTGVSLKYGTEISRYFDLSWDFTYQSSTLVPNVQNASVTFRRMSVSFTPALIIPIQDGEYQRLKLGAGVRYYPYTRFEIDAAGIPGGFNDKQIYDNPFGFHASLNYEINFAEHWSACYGIAYYVTSYSFVSSANGFRPLDRRLSNPDGSGFDLAVGLFYHFGGLPAAKSPR